MSSNPSDAMRKDTPKVDSQPFLDATAKARSHYGRFNLGIVGNTGVGKSSLVNAVFGRDLAKVGKGLPVTSGVHYYHDDSLGIWDFEGFEIGSQLSPAESLRQHLQTVAQRPADEQISVVWYCVLAGADRLTQPDIDMIRELATAGLPVIVVLTKVNWTRNPVTRNYTPPKSTEEFRDWLKDPVDDTGAPIYLPIRDVILTSTQDEHGKGTGHGLGDLVAETLLLSPESEKDAFRIAQQLNLQWKREMARPVIVAASAAAAAAAAVPIPITDAVALAPIQMTMMARLATIYDLELKTMLSVSTLAQLSAQVTGQALARSFIKLVPVAGSVVNASVASALTAATGEAWMRLCEHVHMGKIDLNKITEVLDDYTPNFLSVIAKLAPKPKLKR